ncbi:sugar transferase, partial [Ruegeria atlantica]|uniref:sugar transferase n=1 Tax=Ruegeria atlantica TaxID=81569 RepID=UPI002494BF9A
PRPDYIEHARMYLLQVPGYQERHDVRPGISGLAQVELGYIEGTDATRRKVQADLYYIANSSLAMEMRIVWRTLAVMVRRGGA